MKTSVVLSRILGIAVILLLLAGAAGMAASQAEGTVRFVLFVLAGAGVGAAAACVGLLADTRKAARLASGQIAREATGGHDVDRRR